VSKLRFLSIIVVIALLLAACGSKEETPEPTSAPEPTAETTSEEPTQVPEVEPTAEEQPAEPTSIELPEGVESILTVKLRQDLEWSDGAPVTAQDLVGRYDIMWAQNGTVWRYLQDVVAVDEYTVEFWMKTASPRALRLLLRSYQPAPYSEYGDWMDQAAEMRAAGADPESDEVQAFLDALYADEPDTVVTYGPFTLDPDSVTEAQLELVKNPNGYHSDLIDFDKVLVYFGETAEAMPLVLAGEIDYSTHGYTPSDVETFQSMPNLDILSGPTGVAPGLWFNQSVYPLDVKEVRQAFAYVIDREENAAVAMGPAGHAIEYMAGFTDLQVPTWLDQETIDRLNPYAKDWDKAAELLESVGFSKDGDAWVDDNGDPLAFEISVPADFADWLATAENAAQQLSLFGIDATVRGYPSSERGATQSEGNYDILIDISMYYNPPHPQTSFNYYLNVPRNDPENEEGMHGMNWDWNQTTPDGQEVYIPDLLDAAVAGLDIAAHRPYVQQLALLLNEELPVLAMFERHSTDPINIEARVAGWLPADDPIYGNSQGADNYAAIQFLDGTLKVGPNGDGSFHTIWPYPQPPNYVLNTFATTSLPQRVGTFANSTMYPPLFWYHWADAQYMPVAAESYELRP